MNSHGEHGDDNDGDERQRNRIHRITADNSG